eukprot:9502881-Pyramimonas_sp.AAC.1
MVASCGCLAMPLWGVLGRQKRPLGLFCGHRGRLVALFDPAWAPLEAIRSRLGPSRRAGDPAAPSGPK